MLISEMKCCQQQFLIDLIEVAQTLLSSFDYVLTRWKRHSITEMTPAVRKTFTLMLPSSFKEHRIISQLFLSYIIILNLVYAILLAAHLFLSKLRSEQQNLFDPYEVK